MGFNHQIHTENLHFWQHILFREYQHHVCDSAASPLIIRFISMSRNNAEFLGYIQSVYFNGLLPTQQLDAIGVAYPDDITQVVSSVS